MLILFWTKIRRIKFSIYDQLRMDELSQILPGNIHITYDRDKMSVADVVMLSLLFLYRELEDDLEKPEHQIWVVWGYESEVNYPWMFSDEFYDCAKASINNRYIYDLYFPMVNKQILRKDIPEGYFDEDLRVTNSLSRLYITALWYLYIYNYTEDIYNNFDLVYNHIINDFEGDERAYLMSAMIGLFASKNSTSYSEQLLNAIEKASQYTQNEVCLRYIEKAKMFYTLLDRQILENILENTYLR